MDFNVLDRGFDTAVRMLPIPDLAEEGIIAAKNILKDEEFRKTLIEKAGNLFNKNGKLFNNISEVKDAINKDGLVEGISKAGDILISNAKASKLMDKNVANILKGGKDLLVDNFIESKNEYAGQDDILKSLSMNFEKLEKLQLKGTVKEINNLEKEIIEKVA